jgi:hypothetical protein
MVLGILAGALAWIATVVAFAVGFRLGSLVPVGTAIAVGLLLAGGVWQLGPAHGRFLILLSLLELILAIAAGRAVSR